MKGHSDALGAGAQAVPKRDSKLMIHAATAPSNE